MPIFGDGGEEERVAEEPSRLAGGKARRGAPAKGLAVTDEGVVKFAKCQVAVADLAAEGGSLPGPLPVVP